MGPVSGTGEPSPGIFFKLTPTGELTTFESFDGINGCFRGLIKAADNTFYGTTYYGGENDTGTVFKITANGINEGIWVMGLMARARWVWSEEGRRFFMEPPSQATVAALFWLIHRSSSPPRLDNREALLLKGVRPPNFSYRLWASGDVTAAFRRGRW
jgi:uncharacterized repeat protein (TIGR03803 family)